MGSRANGLKEAGIIGREKARVGKSQTGSGIDIRHFREEAIGKIHQTGLVAGEIAAVMHSQINRGQDLPAFIILVRVVAK